MFDKILLLDAEIFLLELAFQTNFLYTTQIKDHALVLHARDPLKRLHDVESSGRVCVTGELVRCLRALVPNHYLCSAHVFSMNRDFYYVPDSRLGPLVCSC